MLQIKNDDFNALCIALHRGCNHVRLLNGLLADLPAPDRVRAAALAALTVMTGDHVLVESEIHLVPPKNLATFTDQPFTKDC